jgi:hypothetical protein
LINISHVASSGLAARIIDNGILQVNQLFSCVFSFFTCALSSSMMTRYAGAFQIIQLAAFYGPPENADNKNDQQQT